MEVVGNFASGMLFRWKFHFVEINAFGGNMSSLTKLSMETWDGNLPGFLPARPPLISLTSCLAALGAWAPKLPSPLEIWQSSVVGPEISPQNLF